jgi:hypothetical protein
MPIGREEFCGRTGSAEGIFLPEQSVVRVLFSPRAIWGTADRGAQRRRRVSGWDPCASGPQGLGSFSGRLCRSRLRHASWTCSALLHPTAARAFWTVRRGSSKNASGSAVAPRQSPPKRARSRVPCPSFSQDAGSERHLAGLTTGAPRGAPPPPRAGRRSGASTPAAGARRDCLPPGGARHPPATAHPTTPTPRPHRPHLTRKRPHLHGWWRHGGAGDVVCAVWFLSRS